MPYTSPCAALSTIFTILVIIFAIGVLLYGEKHHRQAQADVATRVNQPEKTAAMLKGISRSDAKVRP